MLRIFPDNSGPRKWNLLVLIVLLLFGLLAWGVWLYYNDQLKQIGGHQSNP